MTHKQILLNSSSRGDSAPLFPAHCHQISSFAPSRYKAMRRSTEAEIELLAAFRLNRENGVGKPAKTLSNQWEDIVMQLIRKLISANCL